MKTLEATGRPRATFLLALFNGWNILVRNIVVAHLDTVKEGVIPLKRVKS